jgi:membrane protein YqaA with SNARE-associated domain
MKLSSLLSKLKRSEKNHKKFYFALLIFLAFVLFLPVFFQIRFHSLRSFGLIGVFFINLFGSATIFLPAPGILSVGISATQSDPLLVAIIGAIGASLGEGTTFLFGYTSNKFFELEKHKWIKKFKKSIFDRWGSAVILFFAFIPNPLFDGIGMIAGLSKFSVKKFLFLTFIGRLLRYLVIAYVSNYIALR